MQSLRVRTLRSALSWAYAEGLIWGQPLAGVRGPGQPEPRRDVPAPVVRDLLAAADAEVDAARAQDPAPGAARWLHQVEQVRLALRLAADTGVRRGELSAQRVDDLRGRVLIVERGVSDGVLTTTKGGRARRVTAGAQAAELWSDQLSRWEADAGGEPFGPWLFSAVPDHGRRLPAGSLGHWFAEFVARHGHGG